MILLTGFYVDADPRRHSEILECLRRNTANPYIDEIHLLVEQPVELEALRLKYPELAAEKIRLVLHARRAAYAQFFSYANTRLPGTTVVLANADIYFDRSLARLLDYDLHGRFLCLTRWDVQSDGSASFFEHPASQDAWIFQTPLRHINADFHLGVLGCDNRLAWEAEHAGLTLSNPGRSVRAYHLHHSDVRRYSRWGRLAGPTRAVPPHTLDTPWLWCVIPFLGGQLDELQRTCDSLLRLPHSTIVVSDGSPGGTAASWVERYRPQVLATTNRAGPRTTSAVWNAGAAAADEDGILCFVDAGLTVSEGFTECVFECVEDEKALAQERALACTPADFRRALGFDELIADATLSCADLATKLTTRGAVLVPFRQELIVAGETEPEPASPVDRAYLRAKTAIVDELRPADVSAAGLRELRSTIERLRTDQQLAEVAFCEEMGYQVARLEPGVSSHTNIARPFTAVPEPLNGLWFTQVVASAVSPVEVELLSPGKFYVLAGTDWGGYELAREWLKSRALRENVPALRTSQGTAFEVWSLSGEATDRFKIPTQVMLAASQLERGPRQLPPSLRSTQRERIFALTSLPPSTHNAAYIRACIQSWRDAGMDVRAFNHPQEIASLSRLYDVEFVPVVETAASIFGKHVVPIKTMLNWANAQDAPILLLNADIQLNLADWELKRLRWLCNDGLCYLVRFNHTGDMAVAQREPFGIDAFFLHGRHVRDVPPSFMSMGEPFWDYWLPHIFASHERPIYSVQFPAAFHRVHPQRWSWVNWHRCALEFARVTGEPTEDTSFQAAITMSVGVRQRFEGRAVDLTRSPFAIRDWVQRTFGHAGAKTFVELGAHRGTDTCWMAEIPDVTIHAVEPDPRNTQPWRPNVIQHRAAIADHDGAGKLILSQSGWGMEWTHSSSIKQPKHHLRRFPVTFGQSIDVRMVTLDTLYRECGLKSIDFIWADIQGAEGDMIRGGELALAHTRYLYTEYSDDELYEDQPTLKAILEMLPDYRVVELWPDDVLLENRAFRI